MSLAWKQCGIQTPEQQQRRKIHENMESGYKMEIFPRKGLTNGMVLTIQISIVKNMYFIHKDDKKIY